MKDAVKPIGEIKIITENKDGSIAEQTIKNLVVQTGRNALVSCLANNIGQTFNFYIAKMIFSDGGAIGGVPKVVNANMDSLFNSIVVSKPVIANVDVSYPSQVNFTAVLTFSDANGSDINEMALELGTGDLYSMSTFAGINKTSSIQITFVWTISMV